MPRLFHHAALACALTTIAMAVPVLATPQALAPQLANPMLQTGAKTITLTRKKAQAAPTATRASFLYHRVQPGDTLYDLARKYETTTREIMLANAMTGNALKLGVSLKIPLHAQDAVAAKPARRLPPGVRTYRVRAGEVVSSIAAKFDLSEADVVSANPNLPSLDRLAAGTELLIPTKARGLIVKLKPGQSLVNYAIGYKVSLTQLAAANGVADPRGLRSGDLIVVPGVRAEAAIARLEAKREAEIAYAAKERQRNAARAEARKVQAQYEAFLQFKKSKAKALANATSKRESLRQRQLASVKKVQRAAIIVRPVEPDSGGGYRWPMNSFTITSGYGRRGFWIGRSNFHTGIDLASSYRAPIYAAKSGTVIEAGYGYFGLNVRVSTGRGITNVYGHMSRIRVRNGEFVRKGELIGYQGCTGICTGPHLHFEVQVNGVPRNPLRYLP